MLGGLVIVLNRRSEMALLREWHVSRGPKKVMQESCGYLREECSRQREEQVQKSWGRVMCDLLKEQWGGPSSCEWLRREQRRWGWGGDGAELMGPGGPWGRLYLFPPGVRQSMAFGMHTSPSSIFSISDLFFPPEKSPPLATPHLSRKSKPTGRLAWMK